MLKFYRHLDRANFSLRCEHFPATGVRGRSASSVNLGPAHISETVTAKKLKFYRHSDRVKCTFRGASQGAAPLL